jgi:hypothetical protein
MKEYRKVKYKKTATVDGQSRKGIELYDFDSFSEAYSLF